MLKSSHDDSFSTLQVRAGESVNNYEITRFAQLFNDELTLDNLERIQLVNLCRFVGIPPFGTDAFLASRLRAHLARIKVSFTLSLPAETFNTSREGVCTPRNCSVSKVLARASTPHNAVCLMAA